MKYIQKTPEPEFLKSWKRANPGLKYTDFQKNTPLKARLRKSLLNEQYYLCCYCGNSLKDYRDDEYHIEHFIPQHRDNRLTLSYTNMMISCNGLDHVYKDPYERNYCGHRKGKTYDVQMLSPLSPDCEDRLTTSADGSIVSSKEMDIGAQKFIEAINLNNYVLVESRSMIIGLIIKELSSISAEDEQSLYLDKQIDILQTEIDGYLPSFSQEISSFLQSLK